MGCWRTGLLIVLALTVGSLTGLSESPPGHLSAAPGIELIQDSDGDKIFDDLEESLAPAAPGQRFDTIVLLDKPLATATLNNLKQHVGPFGVNFQYPSINGFAANLTKRQITALARLDQVAQIEADREVRVFLDTSTFWFGVQKARTDFPVDGNTDSQPTYSSDDIVIAILDTGIDTGHQDLPPSKVLDWVDFHTPVTEDDPTCSTPCDPYGHGTRVSGIAAGSGAASGGTFEGVAPGAALVGVRVLDRRGDGSTSAVSAGIQWVIDNKDTYNIRIFNMSLGDVGCFDGTDSMSQLVDQAVADGLIAVVAAGNGGPASCTIASPGVAGSAVTVGAVSDVSPGPGIRFSCDAPGGNFVAGGFRLACFSSRGPTADSRIKPDLVGPGVRIHAAQANTATDYADASGTSMSTPFVAGVAALMLHADSNLTPTQVKSILMDTTIDWGPAGDDIDYGAGLLDAFEAIRTAASGTGTSITLPNHQFISDQLPAGSGSTNCAETDSFDDYIINITDPSLALAATLIMPTWGDGVDFDLCLFDDSNTLVASSTTVTRQETVGLTSAPNGPYRLRVLAWAGGPGSPASEPGAYFFDTSVGGTVSAAPPNEPPTADNQSTATNEDTNLTITLTGSDPNGDPLSFIITSLTNSGTLRDGSLDTDPLITSVPHTLAGDQLRYAPDPDLNGSDSFDFMASDGILDSDTATVSITINPVNDPPLVTAGPDQEVTINEALNLNATFADPDIGDTHTCTIDWDDGTPIEAGTLDQVNDACSASHTYTTTVGSPFAATVTVTDSATPTPSSGSDQLLVTVTPPDTDGDGVVDPEDNCPSVPNGPNEASTPGVGNQANTDADNESAGFRIGPGSPPPILPGDAQGDACDTDDDNDGFSDTDEQAIFGVGPGSEGEHAPCRTDTVPDPWPPEPFGPGDLPDRIVNFQDLNAMVPLLFSLPPGPPYDVRFDLFEPGAVINFQDLNTMLPFLFWSCEPPP